MGKKGNGSRHADNFLNGESSHVISAAVTSRHRVHAHSANRRCANPSAHLGIARSAKPQSKSSSYLWPLLLPTACTLCPPSSFPAFAQTLVRLISPHETVMQKCRMKLSHGGIPLIAFAFLARVLRDTHQSPHRNPHHTRI